MQRIKILQKSFFFKFIVFLLFIPVLFINVKKSHNWGGDFAQYINQAKCIVEGKSQLETGYIFSEQNPYLGPPTYPVGFPLLLAPVYFFCGNNIMGFSILISICLFVLAIVLYRLYIKYFDRWVSLIITIAFIYNPWLLKFKSSILSEIPFTLFFIGSVYFYKKHFNEEKIQISRSVFLGLLISFSMLIKNMGIVLIAGMIIDQLMQAIAKKKVYKGSLYNVLIMLFTIIIAYIIVNYLIFPTSTEHYLFFSSLFKFDDIGTVVTGSYKYYAGLLMNFFSEDAVISSFTISLFLIGFIKKLLTRSDVVDYIFLIYGLIILIFPAIQGFRYLLPVYPIVLLYIVFGFKSLKFDIKTQRIRYFQILLFLIMIFFYWKGFRSVWNYHKSTLAGPQTEYSQEAFSYIRAHTDEFAVFAFVKPRVLALYAERPSIGFGMGYSLEEMNEMYSSVGVNYIVTVEDKHNIIIDNYIEQFCSELELFWTNERFRIYKVLIQ